MRQRTIISKPTFPNLFIMAIATYLCLTCISFADYVIKEAEKEQSGTDAISVYPEHKNRTHRFSKVWLTVNNWGWLGNYNFTNSAPDGDPLDYEYQVWAPQCEYPGGSNVQYLFAAGLWVGALIVDETGQATPRVSTGADGWVAGKAHEFHPPGRDEIVERSNRTNAWNRLGEFVSHENAISEQDFVTNYSDTLFHNDYTPIVNGIPHEPLGIEITHKSYCWSYNYASEIIVIDYTVKNIASNFLKNLYIGFYVDADVGHRDNDTKNLDDIAGFVTQAYDSARGQWIEINTAWIADNDGRDEGLGNDFSCPNVMGIRVLRSPNPKLATSFNWWTSSFELENDFGPSWEKWATHPDGDWTPSRGTPINDDHKYFVLSNGEFDYNQWNVNNADWISSNPQRITDSEGNIISEEPWQSTADNNVNAEDVANGYDTRYLVSWGPMGIFDHEDVNGNWIYRLNPGEEFSFTIALVIGKNFHNRNEPQAVSGDLDPDKYDFHSLENSALWAARIYDNEMVDTPIFDFGLDGIPSSNDFGENDGVLDTGDGWFGEDTGSDGLYALLDSDQDSAAVWYFGQFMGWYTGPDEDGSEDNGLLDPGEDELLWGLMNFIADSGYVYAGPRFSTNGHAWVDDGAGDRSYITYGTSVNDWFIGHMNYNGVLDRGDGVPDFQGPPPPPPPVIIATTEDDEIVLRWLDNAETYVDPFSHIRDFEGYRIWVANDNTESEYSLLGEYDQIDFAYFDREGNIKSPPQSEDWGDAEFDSTAVEWFLQAINSNTGLDVIRKPHGEFEDFTDQNDDLIWNGAEPFFDANHNGTRDADEDFQDLNFNHTWDAAEPFIDANNNGKYDRGPDFTVYEYRIKNVHSLFPRYYAVTAFDFGDFKTGTGPLESAKTANSIALAPSGNPAKKVKAVPNPYRLDFDYTNSFRGGVGADPNANGELSWENQNDGSAEYWPQQDRRMEFINLPAKCLIRIYTVSGDLVQIIPHNVSGDKNINWASIYSESWNLNSRNYQPITPGLYIFSVEDQTEEDKGRVQIGKFVVIG
jgi:hypothetical protein